MPTIRAGAVTLRVFRFAITAITAPASTPSHLFLGTPADNNADMIAKGRERYAAGSPEWKARHTAGIARTTHWITAHPERVKRGDASRLSRLTDAQVIEIRRRRDSREMTQAAMAKAFGVSFQHINAICNRKARNV